MTDNLDISGSKLQIARERDYWRDRFEAMRAENARLERERDKLLGDLAAVADNRSRGQ